ncbi:MAG TPA: hypothetical protein VF544_18685 [Pyrinomonadaceae bacterium]|jgi:hypothetical protein
MSEEERLRIELHEKVDAACDARIQEIEEERRNSHRWIDDAPIPLLSVITAKYNNALASQTKPQQIPYSPSNGLSSEPSERFPYKQAIREIIDTVEYDTNISTPPVYAYLKQKYPEIRDNPKPVNVKAQIASALNKLAKDELIYIYKEGGGSIPHIYRRKLPKEVDEAIEGVTGPIETVQQEALISEG